MTARRARAARWRMLAQAVQWPVLGGVALVALLAWVLSQWAVVPWLVGFVVLVVLAAMQVPAKVGTVWAATAVLVVVDVAFVGWYVDPWWWAVLAGLVLTGAGVAVALRFRLRERRLENLGALALGILLLAGGVAGLLLDAAAERVASARDLQAAHDAAVPRILPRTPNAMVVFLVERLTYVAQQQRTRPADAAPTAAEANWVADACFVLAPAAQRQLAQAHGGPDCPAAVEALARQVRDPLDYANNVWVPGDAVTTAPDGLHVDACQLDFGSLTDDTPTTAPGPQLGRLTMRQQQGASQLVVDYQPCP
ncbi:hypothetical protein VSH64_37085 [Amycolatopsis rhabdoformis]|uniref:Uncharacterized protein n=1 Tax=Amycolatopsis rhabdoformis TaxID=1448059 RepID=A0ABZ1I1Z4_9PSEU|nr:hypothetical protein [Amycolatopsis rhabdoformis]WSE28411.1 hypothetical protein VSH64_37085 [Amycolatopsis rhabdoformis]